MDLRGSLVPAEVFVVAENVEVLAERIVECCCRSLKVGDDGGGDEAGGVFAARFNGELMDKGVALRALRGFVGHGPHDHGGVVVVAADHFPELMFGVVEGGRVGPVDAPVDGNFGPDHDAELVGEAIFVFGVGVVRHADEVAVEVVGPAEEGFSVFVGPGAAGAEGRFVVIADAAQEDGFAVEENLIAMNFDGAEADVVGQVVGTGAEGDGVEAGMLGRPELEAGCGEGERGSAICICDGIFFDVEVGNAESDVGA